MKRKQNRVLREVAALDIHHTVRLSENQLQRFDGLSCVIPLSNTSTQLVSGGDDVYPESLNQLWSVDFETLTLSDHLLDNRYESHD